MLWNVVAVEYDELSFGSKKLLGMYVSMIGCSCLMLKMYEFIIKRDEDARNGRSWVAVHSDGLLLQDCLLQALYQISIAVPVDYGK